jgi:hypothetical protein
MNPEEQPAVTTRMQVKGVFRHINLAVSGGINPSQQPGILIPA